MINIHRMHADVPPVLVAVAKAKCHAGSFEHGLAYGTPVMRGTLCRPARKLEDGKWAKHWHTNVHTSTGFELYRPKTEPTPERLCPLIAECRPLYERLYADALREQVRLNKE